MADNVEMQGIEFEIVNDSAAASAGVEVLAKKLAELKTAISGSTTALSKVAAGIAGIKNAVNGVSVSGFESKMSRISASLAKLKTQTDNLKISASIGNQLTSIGDAVKALPDSYDKVAQLAESLKPLSELGKSNLSSFITQLGKIPTVVKDLGKLDMAKFTQQMKDLASAMKPLADEMSQVAAGFSAFPSRIQRLITSTQQYSSTARGAAGHTNSWWEAMKKVISLVAVRTIGLKFGKLIADTTKYTEAINMFAASMGEYAKEAYDFAQKASDVLGIDISEWMQNQGTFNTIITGFGVAGDKAAFMSKNLTQLGYDLASFYNIDVASAMQKVQAGISGELEPLRRLGYDLSVAKLQEEAAAFGITKQVSAMDQAEKSMLRYHAIMTQVTVAQGDMARTLNAPANQIRVLTAQVSLAAREIGNLFIPALNAILPVASAVMKAIRALAASIASLFGIQLASVDYSGISGASGAAADLNDNLDAAGGAASDLKNKLAGFDELNVIQSQGGGGGGGGGADLGLGDFADMELPGYDFLKDAITSNVDKIFKKIKPVIEWITEHLQEVALVAGTIGATILAWRLSTRFSRALGAAADKLSTIHELVLAGASAVLTIGISYILESKGLAGGETENWGNLIESWIASAVGTAVTGGQVARVLGGTAGKYAAGATLAISTVTSIFAIYDDVKTDGFDLKTLADSIWTALKGAAAGGLIALAAGASLAVGATIGAGLTLAGIALAVGIASVEVDTKEAKWGNLELTKEQVTKYVNEKLFTIDAKATVGAIDTVLSDLDSEKGKLNAAIEDFNQSLTLVKLGVDEQGSYEKMLYALTGGATDGSYTDDSILGQLKSVTEQSSVAVKLGFATFMDGENNERYSSLIDTSDSVIQAETQRIGKELADLLAKGMSEGLRENEKQMAADLANTLSRASQAAAQQKIESEFLSNWAFSLVDLTQGSFDAVLEEFATMKTKLREQYQALAVATLSGMESRRAALIELGTPEALEQVKELDAAIKTFSQDMTAYVDSAVERVSAQGADMLAQRTQEIFSDAFSTALKDNYVESGIIADIVASSGDISPETLAENINDYIAQALEKVLSAEDYKSLINVVNESGQSLFSLIPEEIQSTLVQGLTEVLTSQTAVSNLGGDYTSQVFEALGYDLSSSFATGFADDTLNTQMGLDAGGNVISGLSQNDWYGAGAMNGAAYVSGFNRAMAQLHGTGRTSNARIIRARSQIKGYATGGYPQSGELFWARENGEPEMVGQMGGSTAVANNNQIVSGIASGVATANEESNALLREQNELLRRLLQKEFTAEVSPSAEFGRVVARSSRMYEKAYG